MTMLVPGNVVHPISEQCSIKCSLRILQVKRVCDRLIAIPIEPRRYQSKKKIRLYFSGPKTLQLSDLENNLNSNPPICRVVTLQPRKIMLLNDHELSLLVSTQRKRERCSLLDIRDERWELIERLVCRENYPLLMDSQRRAAFIQEYVTRSLETEEANKKRVSQKISYLLNQYFALGGVKNALLPYTENCGGRGKTKTRGEKKLGRPNAPTRHGMQGEAGYQLQSNDFDAIEHSWRHDLINGRTIDTAYRRMLSHFYSDLYTDDSGFLVRVAWDHNSRPSKRQYTYQGRKLTGQTAKQRQERFREFEHSLRPMTGSANDGVCAVGQKAAVDATTTDTELVSLVCRLDRIGQANRVVLADSMFGYIPGFYMGLSPECSATVLLAVLHAMSPKSEWLESLGLEHDCPTDDWIPIQFADILADNTGARTEEIQQSLLDKNVVRSIQHVPTYRSDLNSLVETRHLALHRMSDHKLFGTTRGQRMERGEKKAEVSACLTLIEAIRETARAVHHHNTVEMPEFPLTLEMHRDGVSKTRLDLTRWSMERGCIAGHQLSIEEGIAQILPVWDGVFTESGVKLIRSDADGKKKQIRMLRYVSEDPTVLGLMATARGSGNLEAIFRVNPYVLHKIWYLDIKSADVIPLYLKTKDLDLPYEATIMDVERLEEADAVSIYYSKQKKLEQEMSLDDKIEQTNQVARRMYKEDEKRYGKPPKSKIRKNKKENRVEERKRLVDGMPLYVGKDKHEDSLLPPEKIEEAVTEGSESAETNIYSEAIEEIYK